MPRACCQDASADNKRALNGHNASAGARSSQAVLTAYLVGNPNSGKTTLFNLLTGARQRTGNWPGVTVERREGAWRDEQGEIRFIDLPGVYSLHPAPIAGDAGLDEVVARDAVAGGDYDVLVNVVDAANLERNLHLTAQLMEVERPMVVALNMTDVAEAAGRPVNAQRLSELLGVPVVPLVARRGEGVRQLVDAIRRAGKEHTVPTAQAPWPQVVRQAIERLAPLVEQEARAQGISPRWLAIRLLQGDAAAQQAVSAAALSQAAKERARIMKTLKEVPDLVLADARFDLAHDLASQALLSAAEAAAAPEKRQTARHLTLTERFDRLALNRFAGPVIFFAAMYALFMLTINIGGAFVDFFDILSGALFVDGVREILLALGAPAWLIALLADGIGAGLQTVATFIPIVGMLFIGLTFLEDSGYMARAAFLTDRLMRRIGLPGKAFVPLIVGFGCNVPAVMAARTLENPRDRIATILMTPFMSCGARLAVFALFAAAFFGAGGQNVVFLLYLTGIAAAILTGFLVKKLLLRAEEGLPFIMELPPYRLPSWRGVLTHAWVRLRGFVFGAGKIIVVVVALLGMLNALGTDGTFGHQNSENSVLSAIGKAITPLFAPIGISEHNWPATVGLFTGVFAKEVVVGTLNALYAGLAGAAQQAAADFDLWAQVKEAFASIPRNLAGLRDALLDPLGLGGVGSLQEVASEQGVQASAVGMMVRYFDGKVGAFAYMLFVLLYFPCAATFGAIAREIGLRWALFAAGWSTWLGWFAAAGFYQAATFTRHPFSSALWLAGLALGMAAAILVIRWLGRRQLLTANERTAAGDGPPRPLATDNG